MNTRGRKTSRWKSSEVEKSLVGREQNTDQNIDGEKLHKGGWTGEHHWSEDLGESSGR